MMAININWSKLRKVYKDICNDLSPNTDVVFVLSIQGSKPKRSTIKLKNFLQFFWIIENNENVNVQNVIVQTKDGDELYRHKNVNKNLEQLPDEDNSTTVLNWNKLSEEQKEVQLKILIAQITSTND